MKNPLVTMSAVTGKPSSEEIFAYLKSLKDNGIEQAMVYPRSGCELEYLEEEWFEAVGHFVHFAEQLNMSLWIYDDFNWPSGDAHGRVSSVEKFRLKSVCTSGEGCGKISCYSQNKGSLFREIFFPNLLNDEATDYFIQCTHEQYYRRFGEYFGNVIKGFFTDEPGVGYCCTEDSMPYYDGMAEDYNTATVRDFFEDMKEKHCDFYAVSLELIGKKYRSCFIEKLSVWCKAHNVILTGHLMEDTTPNGATKQCGDLLKALLLFGMPGIDELRTRFDDLCLYNLLGSVQYGRRNKEFAMAELFALGPCNISYAKKRSMLYLCSCFGINRYFLAVSAMDMRGNMTITDYFNLFTADCPDFEAMKILSNDAKKASKLADKAFTPQVYIRYPTKICTRQMFKELNFMRFYKLVNSLTHNQIQWKYLDDGDVPENIPVIEFTNELEYILDGKKLCLEAVLDKFRKKLFVTDCDGKISEGIFVRRYDDGTSVVLNLYAKPDTYLVDGQRMYLEENAVRICDEKTAEKQSCKIEKAVVEFDVEYANMNMIRAMYVNDVEECVIVCEKDVEVYLAVRKDTHAAIDGAAVSGIAENSPLLCNGLKKLYLLSEKMTLKRGEHTLSSVKDVKYLPSVFILGDFSQISIGGEISKVRLSERPKKYLTGDKIYGFGKVTFSGKIKIPTNAETIILSDTSLYTSVYIDNVFCGDAVYPPYNFNIPQKAIGKEVDVKIVQASSLGPIFGDVEYFTQNSKITNWKTPSPEQEAFGLSIDFSLN